MKEYTNGNAIGLSKNNFGKVFSIFISSPGKYRITESSISYNTLTKDGKVLKKEGQNNKEHLHDLLNHPVPDSPAVLDGDDSFIHSQCQGKQLYAV